MSWVQVVLFVASMVLAFSNRPRQQDRQRTTLEDVGVPTAEEGRVIPILFGTRDLKSANCVWYGDLNVWDVRQRESYTWDYIRHYWIFGF
jgi:hypothetical protein